MGLIKSVTHLGDRVKTLERNIELKAENVEVDWHIQYIEVRKTVNSDQDEWEGIK